MKITVTEQHIERGRALVAEGLVPVSACCPVALALVDAMRRAAEPCPPEIVAEVRVLHYTATVELRSEAAREAGDISGDVVRSVQTPPAARKFIADFDRDEPLHAITFDVPGLERLLADCGAPAPEPHLPDRLPPMQPDPIRKVAPYP